MCTCRGSTAESESRRRLHNDAVKDFSELLSDQKNSNHRWKGGWLLGCSSEVTLIAVGFVIPRCTCCCSHRTQPHRDRQPGTPCDLPWETTSDLYHPSEMILLIQASQYRNFACCSVFTLVNISKSRTLMSFYWGKKKKKKKWNLGLSKWGCVILVQALFWVWNCQASSIRQKGEIKNTPERSLGLEIS